MKPGWYKESKFKAIFEESKELATQNGHEGERHRDETTRIFMERVEELKDDE